MELEDMSDAELTKLYEAKKAETPTPVTAEPVVPATTNYNDLSDEELFKQYSLKKEGTEVPIQTPQPEQNVLGNMEQMATGIEGFTPTEPNLAPDPITSGELVDKTVYSIQAQGKEFQEGDATTFAGIYQSGLDLANAIGIDVSEESELNQKTIALLNKSIDDSSGGALFSMGNLGKIAPSLATLPVAVKSKAIAFFLEGSIGYAEGRGEGLDKSESGLMALISGGGTVAVMGAVDLLTRDKSLGLYKYIKKFANITDAESDNIFKNWQKTMDAPDTSANRTKALIDSMGEKGAQFKIEAAASSPQATSTIEANIKARRQAVSALADGSTSVQHTANAIAEASDIVKDNYSKVKGHIVNKPSSLRLEIPEGLDEATIGDAKALKDIFKNEIIMVDDLIDSMPHVNSLLRKTKGVTKNKWSVIKDQIDDSLKSSLTKADYDIWTKANSEYAQMANVTTSSIGKVIKEVKLGTMTPELALKKIKTLSGGEAMFKDLEFLIGKEQTAAFEKNILREALGKNSEFVDWAHLARTLDTKGFVTETGKNIKKAVDDVAKSFITDDVLQQISFKNPGTGAGMSDNLIAKAQFSTMHKLYTSIVKHIPFNATSKHLLRMDELAGILKDTNKVKNLNTEINSLAPGVRKMIQDDFITEATKQIEYKPKAKQTGDVNLDPLYVTPKGSVGGSDVTLVEAQRELVQNALGSNITTDSVMTTVDKVMSGKRVDNIIKSVGTRMRVEDAVGNQNMLEKIIKTEVDGMVNMINKDAGVKLPGAEVEKLYHMKIENLLKDCK